MFLAFCVILVTLVGQGLTLGPLIKLLKVVPGDEMQREEDIARRTAIDAALAELERARGTWPDHVPLIDRLVETFEHRAEHIGANGDEVTEAEQERLEHRAILGGVLNAERRSVIEMRERGLIADQVLRKIERELDLEELRLSAEASVSVRWEVTRGEIGLHRDGAGGRGAILVDRIPVEEVVGGTLRGGEVLGQHRNVLVALGRRQEAGVGPPAGSRPGGAGARVGRPEPACAGDQDVVHDVQAHLERGRIGCVLPAERLEGGHISPPWAATGIENGTARVSAKAPMTATRPARTRTVRPSRQGRPGQATAARW